MPCIPSHVLWCLHIIITLRYVFTINQSTCTHFSWSSSARKVAKASDDTIGLALAFILIDGIVLARELEALTTSKQRGQLVSMTFIISVGAAKYTQSSTDLTAKLHDSCLIPDGG